MFLALLAHNGFGRGHQIEVVLFDTATTMLLPKASNVLNRGCAIRTGTGHPDIVHRDLFPTGTVSPFLAIGNDRLFRSRPTEAGLPDFGICPR